MEGSEFMDIEAGGFDEGEGSKNVNDKVDQDNLVFEAIDVCFG